MAEASICQSGIYAIRNLTNGKRYIGSTGDFRRRWAAHRCDLRKGRHSSRRLQAAWSLYGEAAFAFEIVEPVSEPTDLLRREQFYLDELKVTGRGGYNCRAVASSNAGYRHTEESKRKISAAMVGVPRPYVSELFRGRSLTKEHVEKVASANRGQKRSGATKARISAKMMGNTRWVGRKHTEAAKEKMAAAAKGRIPRKGWHHDEAAIAKMRSLAGSKCKPVEIDGVCYASFRLAAEALGLDKSAIGYIVRSGRGRLLVTASTSGL